MIHHLPVILNLFQDPGAAICHTDTVFGSPDRAWILKQVQDDGCDIRPATC